MTESTVTVLGSYSVKVVKQADKTLVRVTDILHALGIRNKKSCFDIYTGLTRSNYRFKGQRGTESIVMTSQNILSELIPAVRKVIREGTIYCFKPCSDNFYKFGCTSNWEKRRKAYTGLNRISELLLLLKVKNTRLAEHNILRWARKLMGEPKIGHEWFYCEKSKDEIHGRLREYSEEQNFCDGSEIDSVAAIVGQL